MIRTALAGLLASFAFAVSATAAPPPPPPGLPADTPVYIMGYKTADMYRSFIRWTEREADRAVAAAQEADTLGLEQNGLPRALSFHVDGDWPYTNVEGGIEMVCDPPGQETGPVAPMLGTPLMSEDDQSTQCYWQMRIIDLAGGKDLAHTWMGDAFNPVAAASHLGRLGIKPGADLMGRAIDWSGYQDSSALHEAPILRVRRYTSRTCGEVINALGAIEAIELGALNIEDFGHNAEVEQGIPHSPWLTTTVYSINAGARAEITFKGTAGVPSALLDEVDRIIWSCSPVD
ncbi:MAG: hypothetical protein RIB03_08160 [Henriciella sp.]|uniref:hypothetical protein n=1 Tax=Henriciella sp. TaxID=1968823 RepID=UPI0032EE5CC7